MMTAGCGVTQCVSCQFVVAVGESCPYRGWLRWLLSECDVKASSSLTRAFGLFYELPQAFVEAKGAEELELYAA